MIQRLSSPGAGSPTHRWHSPPVDTAAVDALATAVGVPRVVAEILCRRGIQDAAAAASFLHPKLTGLHPPEVLPDIDAAVNRIERAVKEKTPICIYGDYDADGVTASALLLELFRFLGAEVDCYIPHRLREGYGVHPDAVRRIAAGGAGLMITVDGGSNHAAEFRLAAELGVDSIVTDHHLIHGELPDVPVVHPGRVDHPTPFSGLAGVGVAYKLVWALGQRLSGSAKVTDEYRDFMLSALAFVALGTVADVVPLLDENRVLVSYGLQALARTERPGLRALMDQCKIDPSRLTSQDIAFKLAPHLNAAGRLGRAEDALALLLTRDPEEAERLASDLASANRRRKEIERRMLEECEEQIAHGSELDTGALVLAREGWHAGVAGIVAARLVDRYHRAAFVIALENGLGRGSIRSTPQRPLDPLYEVGRLSARSIGGHACAGGLTVDQEHIDEFRHSIQRASGPAPDGETVDLLVDGHLRLGELSVGLVDAVAGLEPFGHDNPVPRFRLDDLELARPPRLVGKGEDHLALHLRQGGRVVRSIFFRGAHWAHPLATASGPFSVVGELQVNEFRGVQNPELRIVDIDLG